MFSLYWKFMPMMGMVALGASVYWRPLISVWIPTNISVALRSTLLPTAPMPAGLLTAAIESIGFAIPAPPIPSAAGL